MTTAHVLINCEDSKKNAIIENLKHVESVKEVHGTFGAFDVIAKIENDIKDKIQETVAYNIRTMEDIRSTLTLIDLDK
ncbi:Lrp/AsnC ligand binding domain-containing protein [Nitrosopumilus sp. K4]|uniref:Lrp/AsnC ligand binding domain-containing protein n=1 Tax=Nitrosopumilus sp. K4 TaxID=2795383 RepID=UPI001BAE478A|nr:Lrp/AsnC ligand binding domain-containing protein [Nitrosopumilus sp. K4]QUC65154.1 Lrp/AsnC ligand binding domain-containing protein [Nitrosopumilus sp. K4]